MMRYLKIAGVVLSALLSACIENDIPYPKVDLSITAVTGPGFTVSDIDAGRRVVTLALDERTDIRSVRIEQVTLDVQPRNISLDREELLSRVEVSEPLTGTFDLRVPREVTLSLYDDRAVWTIRAEQTIERRFAVEGQIGATRFDLENRIATAYVPRDTDLSEVTVTALRLGPEGITDYSPTLEELSGTSFETVRFVEVTCHSRTERWMLYVLETDLTVQLRQADAWTGVIWLYGDGVEGMPSGFRVRREGEEQWRDIAPDVCSGGSFSARVSADPETSYEVAAYCGEAQSASRTVTTGPATALVNGDLEDWCSIEGGNGFAVIYPYPEQVAGAQAPFWGTGNVGSALAKKTLTQPTEDIPAGVPGRYAADLKSLKATVLGLGKFAAGNLFVGRYVRNAGTNGILTFGRPFTERPTRLRFWVRYERGLIDEIGATAVSSGLGLEKGMPDNGIVYVALGTWTKEEYGRDKDGTMVGTDDSPLCVDTRDPSTFFKPAGKDVVGYAEYVMTSDVDQWRQVELEIDYRGVTDRVPTHLMIVCSASRWGDYFAGSTQSHMWVDHIELLYD